MCLGVPVESLLVHTTAATTRFALGNAVVTLGPPEDHVREPEASTCTTKDNRIEYRQGVEWGLEKDQRLHSTTSTCGNPSGLEHRQKEGRSIVIFGWGAGDGEGSLKSLL